MQCKYDGKTLGVFAGVHILLPGAFLFDKAICGLIMAQYLSFFPVIM